MLERIKKPIQSEYDRYDDYLKESLRSDIEMAQVMLSYILETRGKGIRPILTLLSALLYNDKETLQEQTLLAAMLVEMTHTASLVHDDVLDEAYIRRGKPSAKAMWRSRRAVLVGDYLLAKSYLKGMRSKSFEVVAYIVETLNDLCEGELIQSDQSDRLEMTREIYYDIIYKKTASLLGCCCGAALISIKAPHEEVERIRRFGDNLGMAFQIKDDILDYQLEANIGKPNCADLRERKITLPLLTVLEQSSQARRREIISMLSNVRNRPHNVDKIHSIVIKENGIEMAQEVMDSYVDRAKKELEYYPGSKYREALYMLCDYIAQRDR